MTVINTRKLRKIGNSKVLTITIPEEVIQTLNVNEGQKIAFNIDNGQVLLTDNKEMDILSMADQVSNQYGNALKGLVNRQQKVNIYINDKHYRGRQYMQYLTEKDITTLNVYVINKQSPNE